LSYNSRSAYLDIRDYRQEVPVSPVWFYGLVVARRYDIRSWFRLQLTTRANWGAVDSDTLTDQLLTNGTSVDQLAVTDEYFHLGIGPEAHYVLPSSDIFCPYVRIGVGANFVRVAEQGHIIGGDGLGRQAVQLPDAINAFRFSVDFLLGLGLDIRFSKRVALAASLYTSYWQPVSYDYSVDLPLYSATHWESFRSFGVQLALLFRGS
jgi:hypothetical protein